MSSDPARQRLVVLISGAGTNLQALLDVCQSRAFPAEVVAVGADRVTASGLDRAVDSGIPTFVVDPSETTDISGVADRDAWDAQLADEITTHRPDWIVSAGFMRILGPKTLAMFPEHIVNTHPALLPSFPGAHAVTDALNYGVKITGCTVHLVDAGVDTGPVLAQVAVEVLEDDDEAQLHERIKVAERQLLVDVIERLCRSSIKVSGRKVTIT